MAVVGLDEAKQASVTPVFAVPVGVHWLVYVPLAQVAALVNEAQIQRSDKLVAAFAPLHQPAPAPHSGLILPDFVGIITTRTCNMACRYCGFAAGQAATATVPPAIVRTALEGAALRLAEEGRGRLEVHFFGGEPFCAPDVIRDTVHAARYIAGIHGLQTWFEASTNGCLSDSMLAFCEAYFDAIVLSLDGPAEQHDRTRPLRGGVSSFDQVCNTARRLRTSPVELAIRSCVTSESCGDLARTCQWMIDEFAPAAICFEPLQQTRESDAAGLQAPGPLAFARAFAGAAQVADRANVRAVYTAADVSRVRHTFCPVGRDTLIVHPDGLLSACYLIPEEWRAAGIELAVGSVSDGRFDIDQKALGSVRSLCHGLPQRCQTCLARWNCAGGCHVHQSPPNGRRERNDFCTQTRLLTAHALLRSLGENDLAQRLLQDEALVDALVLHPDDRLQEQP